MADLQLALNAQYFNEIKTLVKTEEYRLYNAYWQGRLIGKRYDNLIITKGYPKRGDPERTMVFRYHGYEVKTITHPHFGPEPVTVFAIPLKPLPYACDTCCDTGIVDQALGGSPGSGIIGCPDCSQPSNYDNL